ncbi:MAG: DEAD/DEAH box helicase domain-containing protein, partial [Myxococcota bacterium]
GFKKVKFDTHENVGYGEVHLPEVQMHTSATWVTVPEAIIAQFECGRERVVDALRGLGRALHTVATLRMMCSGGDIGLAVDEPEDSGPRLYLYDNIPGGVGFSGRLFEMAEPLIAGARQLIATCSCEDGCPSCIGASQLVQDGARSLPVRLADALLGREVEPLPRFRVIE